MPRGQKRPADVISLRVQCEADESHGKMLRFKTTCALAYIEALAALITGTSEHYVFPPGPGSPIGGGCRVCGAKLRCTIEPPAEKPVEVDEHAEHRIKIHRFK